jgi:CRP-like cAMP-binding protein
LIEVKVGGWQALMYKNSEAVCMSTNASMKLTSEDLRIVTRIAVFRGLKPDTVEHILAPATAVMVRPHELLFRQGEQAAEFFIIVNGWVKLFRITASGEETVIHILAKGDSFAEAVAFTGRSYPATAEAISAVRVVRLSAAHLVRCLKDDPDIALAMIASTLQHLHNLVQQIEQLKVQSGVQRVAAFLVSLCSTEHGSCAIALPYDKALIAARLGLKPESLSRSFAKLKAVGVSVDASNVVVSDVAKLRQFASGDRGVARGALRLVR